MGEKAKRWDIRREIWEEANWWDPKLGGTEEADKQELAGSGWRWRQWWWATSNGFTRCRFPLAVSDQFEKIYKLTNLIN